LATKGTSQITYKDRLNLLSTAFKQNLGFTHVSIIDARCNVLYIITELLKDTPSAVEKRTCDKGCLKNDLACPSIILKLPNGVESLQSGINNYLNLNYFECKKCNGNIQSTRYLKEHLFIETDMYYEKKDIDLDKLQVQIKKLKKKGKNIIMNIYIYIYNTANIKYNLYTYSIVINSLFAKQKIK